MIGSLSGTVRGIIRNSVILEVGGVGYRVAVTADTLASIADGQELFFWTHLAVRENAQDLYGFMTRDELQWFELLLTVSGVGPKSALAVMNAAGAAGLKIAVSRNDAKTLSVAYGIGKKTAEKIVLELREKAATTEKDAALPSGDADAVEALVGLGYSLKEARDAVRDIPAAAATPEERIREAIRRASRA